MHLIYKQLGLHIIYILLIYINLHIKKQHAFLLRNEIKLSLI